MSEIRGSVDIRRPVEEVFAYLSEPKNNLQWETGVVEMELDYRRAVGGRLKGTPRGKTDGNRRRGRGKSRSTCQTNLYL